VVFSYGGKRAALRRVSLAIPRGQSVALVGRSGSGKSTIFNLLTRFYEPCEGAVSVDDHDLRAVTQESLRAQMGVVFQDAFLFRGSVACSTPNRSRSSRRKSCRTSSDGRPLART
jgi:ABC-type multidrug transport system fused ATPase/permease subunit